MPDTTPHSPTGAATRALGTAPRPPAMAVVGIGSIGRGVARTYAEHGYQVWAASRSGEDRLTAHLEQEVRKNRLTPQAVREISARITHCTPQDLPPVDLVVEAVPENERTKAAVLADLDACQPADTILASSTSTIPIGLLAQAISLPRRFLGMHFMTPVAAMPLVEVVRATATHDNVVDQALAHCRAIGKTAVVVKDFPGFVASRLAQAVVNEAAYIHLQGIADAHAIDAIATLALNLPVGPLRLVDETGIDVAVHGMDSLRERLGDARYTACPALRQMTYDGHLGRKTGQGFYTYHN